MGQQTMQFSDLDVKQVEVLEEALSAYDSRHMITQPEGKVSIGLVENGRLLAGADAQMTAFHILYVSTVFVAEEYRGRGIGRQLMAELERRALQLGANMIRLDTFDWQGEAFYRAIGYEQVGRYDNQQDGFSEYFFVKRLNP